MLFRSRLYVDLQDTRTPKPAAGRTLEVNGDLLKRVRVAQFDKRVSRLVLDLGADTDYQISEMANPYRLVIDVRGKVSELDAAIPAAPAPAAQPVAASTAVAVAVTVPPTKPVPTSKPAATKPESASSAAAKPTEPARTPGTVPVAAKPALPEIALAKPAEIGRAHV